jgi:methionyl-tRNA synthetase
MSDKILITAALPYANGPIHLGHLAGAYLPADVYARFSRLNGKKVLFICGSDEYGTAIVQSADQLKRTPKEHVDIFHQINKDLFEQMSVSFDHYSRTTSKHHAPLVQEFFSQLLKNGYIETKETMQLYSENEKRFLADRYVVGICPKCGFNEARGDECTKCGASYEATDLKNPRSKLTSSPLVQKATVHWFLRCDLFKDKLSNWLKNLDWKVNVKNFIEPYIDDLRPRAITRDLEWGVPIPLEGVNGKVLYVWFDAPIGYISATKEHFEMSQNPDEWKDYWLDKNTKYVQFIGKDNIVFHAVIFPSMIMGQDHPYKLVDELPANEFLNLEGKKFSKSTGWYIDLPDFLKRYPSEVIRYTLAAIAPESSDSEFTFKDFQMRINTELVGKFGNFIHRTLTFVWDRMDRVIPKPKNFTDLDNEFLENIQNIVIEAKDSYNHFRVRKASSLIMDLSALANVYFDHKKPWVLLKDKALKDELDTTIYCCLMAIKALALISYPILPKSASKIWEMLGMTGNLENGNWDNIMKEEIRTGEVIGQPQTLFTKMEDATVEAEKAKLQASLVVEEKSDLKGEIEFDDFEKADMRIGQVLHAEPVPKSSKLLKLEIDFGFEKRIIVSGIAKFYKPEDLINKKVMAIINLKPAKIMGVESRGMLLSASDGALVELPFFHAVPNGSKIG